jgi:hypothetical protein
MGDSAPALEDGKRKKDMTLDQLPERSSFADAVSVQTNSLKKNRLVYLPYAPCMEGVPTFTA